MVNDKACWALHGMWYGLARYGMVYDIAWRAWHGIWCGIEMYGMVYCMVWRDTAWYMIWPGEV